MPETRPPPDLAQPIAAIAAQLAEDRPAPVERWNPPTCGRSGIRIAADGRWWHEGRPITRDPLVRQFARVLRREADGSYALVTPVERLTVEVEDLPFAARFVRAEGWGETQRLLFALGTGEPVIAGPDHPLLPADPERRLPALGVRPGLLARIGRASWIELCELALEGEGALWSDGACFTLA